METSTGSFVYVADPDQDPTIAENVNAAIVNAFYVVNTVHDISYLYGFTEAAFNFQNDNQGKGGKGGRAGQGRDKGRGRAVYFDLSM